MNISKQFYGNLSLKIAVLLMSFIITGCFAGADTSSNTADPDTNPGTETPVPVPLKVYASDGNFGNRVNITWREVVGQVTYHVYRSDSLTGDLIEIGTTIDFQYNDAYPLTLAGETRFWYSVKAELDGEFSELSLRNSGYRCKDWILYGSVSSGTGSMRELITTPQNKLYALMQKSDDTVVLMEHNGVNWIEISSPASLNGYSNYCVSADGALFFSVLEGDGTLIAKSLKIIKFQNANWTIIGDNLSTVGYNIGMSYIALDAEGQPWVSYSGGGSYVARFVNGSWEVLPPVKDGIAGTLHIRSLEGETVPVLIWYDYWSELSQPAVMRIDKYQDGAWVSIASYPAEAELAYMFYQVVSSNGEIYITAPLANVVPSKIVIIKMTSQYCKTLTLSGLPTNPGSCSLMVDINNKLYLGYQDWERNQKGSVVTLSDPDTSLNWEIVGRQDISTDGVEKLYMASSADTNYTGYTMYFWENNTWVKRIGVMKLW